MDAKHSPLDVIFHCGRLNIRRPQHFLWKGRTKPNRIAASMVLLGLELELSIIYKTKSTTCSSNQICQNQPWCRFSLYCKAIPHWSDWPRFLLLKRVASVLVLEYIVWVDSIFVFLWWEELPSGKGVRLLCISSACRAYCSSSEGYLRVKTLRSNSSSSTNPSSRALSSLALVFSPLGSRLSAILQHDTAWLNFPRDLNSMAVRQASINSTVLLSQEGTAPTRSGDPECHTAIKNKTQTKNGYDDDDDDDDDGIMGVINRAGVVGSSHSPTHTNSTKEERGAPLISSIYGWNA